MSNKKKRAKGLKKVLTTVVQLVNGVPVTPQPELGQQRKSIIDDLIASSNKSIAPPMNSSAKKLVRMEPRIKIPQTPKEDPETLDQYNSGLKDALHTVDHESFSRRPRTTENHGIRGRPATQLAPTLAQ